MAASEPTTSSSSRHQPDHLPQQGGVLVASLRDLRATPSGRVVAAPESSVGARWAAAGRNRFAVTLSLSVFALAASAERGAGPAGTDQPLNTGEPGFALAIEARVGEVLNQSADRATERAVALLEAREAERMDEDARSAALRLEQQLVRAVEHHLPDPPGQEAIPPPLKLVAHERGEDVYRLSVGGSAGTPSAIGVGGNHSCAIQVDTGAVVGWGNDQSEATPPASVDGSARTSRITIWVAE